MRPGKGGPTQHPSRTWSGLWLFLVPISLALGGEDLQLNEHGGAEVRSWPKGANPKNVVSAYGEPGGVTIAAGGYDVCSLDYTHRVLKKSEFHAVIRPKYQDLSDGKGWPEISVEPGWLALDPRSKRIKFSQGSDSEGFRWVGRLDLGGFAPVGTVIDGDVAYMCCTEDGSGVLFLDISDPADMKVIGNCPIPAFPSSLVKKGHLLFVHAGYLFTVVDVTDLQRPRIVNGFHDRWHYGDRKGAKLVVGDHVIVTSTRHLTVLRTYDDGNLDPVGVCELSGPSNSILVSGKNLILGGPGGLQIVDLSDPQSPKIIRDINYDGAGRVRSVGGVYVGCDGKGLVSFALSEKWEVSELSRTECSYINDIDIVGGKVVVLTGQRKFPDSPSLKLFRVKDGKLETKPCFDWTEQGFIDGVHHNHDNSSLTVSGNRVLVSDFNYGPRLFVLEGEKLTQTSSLMMAGESRGMRIEEDYLHVAKNGFMLIDVFSDPARPRRVGGVFCRTGCFGLASWADTNRRLAYHAASLTSLGRLIDYRNPLQPKIVNEKPPWHQGGIWARDGHMIAFSSLRGQLVTYEVSDAGEFKEVAALDVPGWKYRGRSECWMRVVGDLAYVSIGRTGSGKPFTILDISDPLGCKVLGQLTIDVARTSGIGTPGLYVDSGIAYLGGHAPKGIMVIDCTDPRNPMHTGFIDSADPTSYSRSINSPDELIVVGDRLILGDYITGLRMFQFTNAKRTEAKYVANYLSPPEFPFSVYMNCSGLAYHGRYLYKSNMHDLQVYEIPAPSEVPVGPVKVEVME